MADISAQAVKDLRERTGAGFMDCKRALEESGGDLDAAVNLLRERGQAAAAKKAGREAHDGVVGSYIHTGGRVGVRGPVRASIVALGGLEIASPDAVITGSVALAKGEGVHLDGKIAFDPRARASKADGSTRGSQVLVALSPVRVRVRCDRSAAAR